MPRHELISPKSCCRIDPEGAMTFAERALRIAQDLPDPLGENQTVEHPMAKIGELVRRGILEEVRPRVFKPTGKGRITKNDRKISATWY